MALFNEEQSKIVSFKEDESNKIEGLKKVLKSKFFLGLIGAFLGTMFFYILTIIVSSLSSIAFTATDLFSLVVSILIELIIPYFITKLLITMYKAPDKKNKLPIENSILGRFFSLRRLLNIILIVVGIAFVMSGIASLSVDKLDASYFSYLNLSEEELQIIIDRMKMEGPYYLFAGGAYLLFAYGLSTTSKTLFRTIVIDEKNNKYIEFIVLSIVLGAFGILLLVGNILGLSGVSNYFFIRKVNLDTPLNVSLEIITLLHTFARVSLIGFIIVFLLKIRKALMDNSGTNNVLMNDNVYTLKEEDFKDIQ